MTAAAIDQRFSFEWNKVDGSKHLVEIKLQFMNVVFMNYLILMRVYQKKIFYGMKFDLRNELIVIANEDIKSF